MRSEWEEVRLGDICRYRSEKIAVNELTLKNYISTVNMLPEKAGIENIESLPDAKTTSRFYKYDTLVSNIRPYFKKIWYSEFDGGCSNDVLVFSANDDVSSEYLYYLVSNNKFFEYMMSTSKGTKMPRGDKDAILRYESSLPPLPTQRAIADTLSCLDAKIELNNKINKNLEAQAQAIFKSWFVDFEPFQDGEFVESELGLIPKGWNVGKLGDYADFRNGYGFRSKTLSEKVEEPAYSVFKMGNIKVGGGFDGAKTKDYIAKSNAAELERFVLRRGDLLMAMTDMKGNVALLGHTALMPETGKYILNQRVGLLRANGKKNISFPFLYILTNSIDFIERLRSRANSGVQVNLTTAAITDMAFILPDKNILHQFNNTTLPIYNMLMHSTFENTTLAALRDLLLPKLMSGELEVPLSE